MKNSTQQTMPRFMREVNAVATIVHRDIILMFKSPARLLMALLWPAMMLGMFGSQLSQNMGVFMDFDFNTFMLIGMLVNGLFMITMMGVNSLVEDRENDFTQEILVAPISRFSIILGKIIGSSLASYISFFATIGIGLIIGARISLHDFLILLSLSPLICLAAGSFAVLCISVIKKPSTANFVIVFLVMGQMFLSGALIPINRSTGLMGILSRAFPMTYCVDFTRGVFYQNQSAGMTLYTPGVNLLIIAAFTVIFFVAGTALFVRAEKER